jgi:primary-amine oxidase
MTMESTVPSAETIDNTARYPLDPLTGAEIEAAAAVITNSEYGTATLKFVMIHLAEPEKTRSLTFEGAETPRRAFVSMYDGAAKLVYEAVVDLGARLIESWKSVPGRFPSYLVEHMTGVEEVVRAESPTSTWR